MPSASAAASTKGLNDEPAGRPGPPVARSSLACGPAAEEVPAADEGPHVAGRRLDRHEGGVGAGAGSAAPSATASSAAAWTAEVEGGGDAQPAAEEQLLALGPGRPEAGVVEHEALDLLDEVGGRVAVARPPAGRSTQRLRPGPRPPPAPSSQPELDHAPSTMSRRRSGRVGVVVGVVRRSGPG